MEETSRENELRISEQSATNQDTLEHVDDPNPEFLNWVPTDNGSDSHLKCILHLDDVADETERILPFRQEQWTAVERASKIRATKKNFSQSRYCTVVKCLPDKPAETDGYHSRCYKNFTAISVGVGVGEEKSKLKSSTQSHSSIPHLRSAAESQPCTSSSGVFSKVCIFCNLDRKNKNRKIERTGACETKDAEMRIKEAARKLEDTTMLAKVGDVDFIAKEVRYHHSCRKEYMAAAERATHAKTDNQREQMKVGLESIALYVEKSVIKGKRPELLSSLYSRYYDICIDAEEAPVQTAQYLMKLLLGKFGSSLKVHSPRGRKLGAILYGADTAEDAIRDGYDFASTPEGTVTKAALILRQQVKNMPNTEYPEQLTLEDLLKSTPAPPELLSTFFNVLYGGPRVNNQNNQVKRFTDSSSQDALFVIKRGHVKPPKHVALGIAVKSMTGSKKLVTILNRLGHCINYSKVEELETSLGSSITERQRACPEGTVPGVPMGLAFDNFDELTNTLSGSDTLHDTMGILYQSEPEHASPGRQLAALSSKARKRRLEVEEAPLEPYRKVPKMTVFDYTSVDIWNLPDVDQHGHKLDLIWMMQHALQDENIPMWVGFNAKYYVDNLPKQVVRYMPSMRHPITSLSVVHETLRVAQRCAQECGQRYAVVTYDLNAAKPALQIQATEKPKFDDVFIMLGSFHIEMAFFKALGKLIAESGGPSMLTDCGVLATGSLRGFLEGKHFNRCKRLHPILALAFEILHFKAFLANFGREEELREMLQELDDVSNEASGVLSESSNVWEDCMKSYGEFTAQTRSGEHGATAQFWIMYADYIHSYHDIERAIRSNNIDMFTHSLTRVIHLFFATNHVNYSRWLTKFQLDLLNMDDTHPGLRSLLERGAFTVRRSDNSFSRSPVDLTLEQTVNADAASRMTGISSATNSYSARLRWTVTKSARASCVATVLEMVGLTTKGDAAAELKPARIRRDCADLHKVVEQIKDTCDPFQNLSKNQLLYNISTGAASSDATRECLLHVPDTGERRHREFVKMCTDDPTRFERPIPKVKLVTFRDGCVRNKRANDKKVAALKCTRDLMGRLAILASKKKLDLEHVFSYPLTPVPLSMCYGDGTMAKTSKSTLLKILENRIPRTSPESIDAVIIDGNFVLHALPPNLPPTYGGLATSLLIQTMSFNTKRIDIVFDTYAEPSIKDCERCKRGATEKEYIISGPEQRRPSMNDALKSASFKKQLPTFILDEWHKPAYAPIIRNRHVYLGHLGKCYHFFVDNGVVHREPVEELYNNHEEADTVVCLHAKKIDEAGADNIIIRAADTDIAVIMLHHYDKFNAKLWMEVGTTGKNDRRYIPLSAIASSIGPGICAALPGLHAFTGCDYTSAFVRKGKARPLALLEKDKDIQTVFGQLAVDADVSESTLTHLEEFTATIYGAKKKCTLNEHRYYTVERAFAPKARARHPLLKLKGIDGSSLPPCKAELRPHAKRAAFVARMWGKATEQNIVQHPTTSDGWTVENGYYSITWFDGPQLPETLVPSDEDDDVDSCSDESSDDMNVSTDDEAEELSSEED